MNKSLIYRPSVCPLIISAMLAVTPASFAASISANAYNSPDKPHSWIPYTTFGYAGLNLGVSKYHTPCSSLFTCKDQQIAGKVYTGGLLSRVVGLELGYVNMGRTDRNGGHASAQGANLSLVGNIPVSDAFNIVGRVGSTYGWTKTDWLVGSSDKKGFGLSYGAGIAADISVDTQLVLEWDRQEFNFRSGKSDIDLYSVGLKYKF